MIAKLRIGDWKVDPSACTMAIGETSTKLTPRSMSVLVHLAEHAGDLVMGEALLCAFWPRTVTSPNAVYKVITELRGALRENANASARIETISKHGYRLMARVENVGPPDVTANVGRIAPAISSSIAVLYFRNVDGNPDHDWLVEDPAAALLEGLRQIPDLLVADRDSSCQHSFDSETVQEIGAALDVAHLLDGSVQELDGRLRISVALYRTSDSERVYAYHDDAPIANVLPMQEKLVATVLTALEVLVDERRVNDMRNWGTRNVDAYLAVLEAASFHARFDQKSLRYGVAQCRVAIARDPDFMAAYGLLARTLQDLHFYTRDDALRRPMRGEVKQLRDAVTRRGGDSEALILIKRAEVTMSTKTWSDVEAVARAAIQEEGTPHRAFSGYIEYAGMLKSGHLFREAAQYLDLCAKFAKDSTEVYARRTELAAITLGPRRAIPMYRKVLTLTQNHLGALTTLIAQLALVGEYEEAEAYLTRLRDADESAHWAHAAHLMLGAIRGDWPARSERLRIVLDDPRTNQYTRGIIELIVGDVAAGIAALRRSRENPDGASAHGYLLNVNSEVYYTTAVVNDPRYQDFLDECGIGRRWTAYLRKNVAELAPITGIEPGDRTPQPAHSRGP